MPSSSAIDTLEAALADLRAHPESPSRAANLAIAAQHPQYFLLMTSRGLPTAPDSQGRRLAAIFTSEAARDAFHEQIKTAEPEQIVYTHTNGADLFPWLRDMHLDGLVFNCMGPQKPIAFVPLFIEEVCRILQPEGPAKGDFDRLASAAFPDGQVGPMPALDALWNELFDLREWVFAVRPQGMANPYPYIAIFNGKRCAFAFTDSERARQFCVDNNLLDPDGKNSFHMTMPLPGVLDWIAEAGAAAGEFEVVHFNFGGVGWFCPVENFPVIRRHLGRL
jgi:hypothetical protein